MDEVTAGDQEEKKPRAVAPVYGLAYAAALPALQKTARNHGYALAVHGSLATDLDLVACPWQETVSSADELAEALRSLLGGLFATGDTSAAAEGAQKPHGRRAYTILPSDLFLGVPRLPFVPWIDLSVMPCQKEGN